MKLSIKQTSAMTVSILAILMSSCTTTGSSPEFKESRVVERMGKASESPAWTDGSVPMSEEGQDVVFTGILTMSGDSRSEACMKAADLDARAMMLRHIKDTLTSSGQLNEVSASTDPGYEGLVAFLSNGSIKGARTTLRYWEKVEESSAAGTRVLKLKCAVKIAVTKADLAKQMRDASDVPAGNAEIREKLHKAQGDFIESLVPKSN